MDVNDTALLDAVELLKLFATGDLTPLQALKGVTERIARRNPEVNAFAAMNPSSLAAARESTQRWQAGQARALEGIPVTVSDLVDVAGLPTRRGSKTSGSAPVRRDAPLVAVLRAAGAVIIGKTNVAEFGWKYQGDSPLSGITRNPWNSQYNAGGPSGGAAAAAAGFFGPLHIADGDVSVPAAWCGVVGLKLGTRAENQGIIARSVADVALLSNVLRGNTGSAQQEAVKQGLKIGILHHPGFAASASASSWAAVDKAKEMLAAQGALCSEVAVELPEIETVFTALWRERIGRDLKTLSADQYALLDPALASLATGFAAESVIDQQILATISADAERLIAGLDVDVLICPAVPHEAPFADIQTLDPLSALRQDWAPWTMLFTLTGQAVLTLPVGVEADGLPVAVQIAAKTGDSELVLRVARALEQALV